MEAIHRSQANASTAARRAAAKQQAAAVRKTEAKAEGVKKEKK